MASTLPTFAEYLELVKDVRKGLGTPTPTQEEIKEWETEWNRSKNEARVLMFKRMTDSKTVQFISLNRR